MIVQGIYMYTRSWRNRRAAFSLLQHGGGRKGRVAAPYEHLRTFSVSLVSLKHQEASAVIADNKINSGLSHNFYWRDKSYVCLYGGEGGVRRAALLVLNCISLRMRRQCAASR